MNRKQIAIGLILALLVITIVTSTVHAQRRRGGDASGGDTACQNLPPSSFSIGAFTGGIAFIFAGGLGPIVILVLAFVIGMIVSHVLWGGF